MVAIQSVDIKWAQWIRVARNYQLRVGLKDRTRETFDGFVREVSMHYRESWWGPKLNHDFRIMTSSRTFSSNISVSHSKRRRSPSRAGTGV